MVKGHPSFGRLTFPKIEFMPNSNSYFLQMMYLYFLIIASSASASISSKSGTKCPVACRCDGLRKRVYCNSRALKSIPDDIPIDTKVLYLQDNQLASNAELDITLSTLVNLERVMLYSNDGAERRTRWAPR